MHPRFFWRGLPDWAKAAFIIALIVAGFTSPAWLRGRLNSASDVLQGWAPFKVTQGYAPRNSLMSDVAIVFEPWYELLRNAISKGELPLWNPYQGFGTPHLANGQSALFYPPTWSVVILGYQVGLTVLAASKLFLLGFFTYLFLREIKLCHGASLFGGVAFAFAGFNVDWLYWPLPAVVAALPLLCLGIERAVNNPQRLAGFLLIIFAVALGVVAGHPETFAHVLFVGVLWGLFRLATAPLLIRKKANLFLKLSAAGIVGLSLAAVQFIPNVEYVLQSHSWATPNRDLTLNIPREYVVLNFLPDLLGNQTLPKTIGGYYGNIGTNYNETTGGAVGLAVGLLAVLALIMLRRRPNVLFFGGLAFLVAAIVYRVPVIYEAFASLPLLNQAYNERLSFALAFALVILAAHLVSAVCEGSLDLRQRRVPFITLLFLVAVVVLGVVAVDRALFIFDESAATSTIKGLVPYLARYVPLISIYAGILATGLYVVGKRTIVVVALVFVLFELVLHGMRYEPTIRSELFFPITPTTSFLKNNLGDQRFVALSDAGAFPPDVATHYLLRDLRNYDGVLLEDYVQTVESHGHAPGNWMIVVNMEPKFLSAGSVRYVISSNDEQLQLTLGLEAKDLRRYPVAFRGPGFNIYENIAAWSRAYWVPDKEFFEQITEDMTPPSATLKKETANSIEIDVVAPADGYLVVSDSYTEGWAAEVDGRPAQVERSDLNFRSVKVDKGNHEVNFYYRPRSFFLGLTLSLATLAILFVFGLWHWQRARMGRGRDRTLAVKPA